MNHHALKFQHCPHCKTTLIPQADGGRDRPTCPSCRYVQYLNPAPATAVVLRRGEDVCLVQRRDPPKAGQWTLPAGFLEWEEDVRDGAVREALEETNLHIRITGLRDSMTGILPPDRSVLLIVFDAEVIGGELKAGDDAAAAGWYSLDNLPGPIAFSTHRKILQDLGANHFIRGGDG